MFDDQHSSTMALVFPLHAVTRAPLPNLDNVRVRAHSITRASRPKPEQRSLAGMHMLEKPGLLELLKYFRTFRQARKHELACALADFVNLSQTGLGLLPELELSVHNASHAKTRFWAKQAWFLIRILGPRIPTIYKALGFLRLLHIYAARLYSRTERYCF